MSDYYLIGGSSTESGGWMEEYRERIEDVRNCCR